MSNRKRGAEEYQTKESTAETPGVALEELDFEDPFEDQFEQEELHLEPESDDEGDVDVSLKSLQEEQEQEAPQRQTWRPGVDKLPEGEVLEYDPSAYVMYHSLKTEWPCLSFDIIKDNLGDNRQRFPLSMYMVIGSQADRTDRNKLTVVKMSDLHKIQQQQDSEDEEDSDSDSDEDCDQDPTLEHVNVPHVGGVNRVRNMPQSSGIVSTWADTGKVHIYDLTGCTHHLMHKTGSNNAPSGPAHTFSGHQSEGYAMDWSKVVPGRLATGDNSGLISVWNVETGSAVNSINTTAYTANKIKCTVDPHFYKGHKSSVEDLQWSPTEGTVFTSCSSDKSLRIWDVRGKNGPQISLEGAHEDDINVISWNTKVSYLLASGCDDGSFKVWDLRNMKSSLPLANFHYHKAPVTSIEWSFHDESLLSVSSADDQVTIWDLSVESEDVAQPQSQSQPEDDLAIYPPQMLFIHQGQHNVKELHFHPQIPNIILTTAEDGFNIFKPAISVA